MRWNSLAEHWKTVAVDFIGFPSSLQPRRLWLHLVFQFKAMVVRYPLPQLSLFPRFFSESVAVVVSFRPYPVWGLLRSRSDILFEYCRGNVSWLPQIGAD